VHRLVWALTVKFSRICLTSAVLLAVAISGCSTPSRPPSRTVRVTSAGSTALENYPIDAYILSSLQQAEQTYVTADLIHACMLRFGFNYQEYSQSPSQYYAMSAKIMTEANSRTWGITDLSAAKQYGYGLPPWMYYAPSSSSASLSAAGRLALVGMERTSSGTVVDAPASSGIPKGGCVTKALEEIAAAGINGSSSDQSLVAQISSQSFTEARSSARIKAVFVKWSACMQSHGYYYSDPFASAAAFASARSVTHDEIQVAVTDIECSRKVNVQGVAFAVESSYQDQLISKNATQLAQVQTQVKQAAGALAKLVAKYGATGRP
jgi:hypothetical protein